MRCCFFSILCLLFSQHIYAEQVFRLPEQCLLGSWQSDKEKTLEYNLPVWEWAWEHNFENKISPEKKQFIFDIYGEQEWVFNPDGTGYSYIPPNYYQFGNYKIIKSGRNFLLIQSEYEYEQTIKKGVRYLFFENPNLLCVGAGIPKSKLFDTTNREYFRRITPTPKECVMP